MSFSDPIADMLARIRNALLARKKTCVVPHSRFKTEIVSVLEQAGYLSGYTVEDLGQNKKEIRISLKYYRNKPVISWIQRVSTPGRRVYGDVKEIQKRAAKVSGFCIISTHQGVQSSYNTQVGGEILCALR